MRKHAFVSQTLTRAERAAPFRNAPPDPEPLPAVTRCQVEVYEDGTVREREPAEVLREVAAMMRAAVTPARVNDAVGQERRQQKGRVML